MPEFRYPPKPARGDAVAVLSPSGRSAARFPVPLDLGLARLRAEFGLAETSEELAPAEYVYRVLMGMGERGLLQRFGAIVWGRPKAWSFDRPLAPAEKAHYAAAQQQAVLAAVAEYHPAAPVVFGVDFGHTDPQLIIPLGAETTVDSVNRSITVTY